MELTPTMSHIIRIPLRLIIANLEIRHDAAQLLPRSAAQRRAQPHPYFIEISGAAAVSVALLRVIYHC